MTQIGYIYVRHHFSYDLHDACLMSKSDALFVCDELIRGKMILVFEVPNKQTKLIENLLRYEFRNLQIQNDGGTSFFNKKIIHLIEFGIKYKKLTEEEINELLQIKTE